MSMSRLEKILILTAVVVVLSLVTSCTIVHAVALPKPVVCMHFGSKVPLSLAEKLIDYAKELGAKYIRFDIWWSDIEPKEGVFNMTALRYYREIISYMEKKGIKPIAIIGTGYPQWVRILVAEYYICKLLTLPYIDYNVNHNVNYMYKTIDTSNYSGTGLNISKILSIVNYYRHNRTFILQEFKFVNYIRKKCPILYYASLKGCLTLNDIKKILKECPWVPIKPDAIEIAATEGCVPITPFPLEYIELKKELQLGMHKRTMSDIVIKPNQLDVCGIYMLIVLRAAYQYAKVVSSYIGDLVNYYQLGNELNNPFVDIIPAEYDAAYIYALARGVAAGDPNSYKTIVNIFAFYKTPWPNIPGWTNTLRSWLNKVGNVIDIVGLDYYPGTWSHTSYNDWKPLDELIAIAKQYHKIPAVMETGYPSYGHGHTEEKQKEYIEKAFPAIMQRAEKTHIAFLSWYMLWDEPGSCEFGYCGWGVLRQDFTKKPAWYELHYWFTNILGK